MKAWIRKSFFVMVSILTFGLVSPSQFLNNGDAAGPTNSDVVETADLAANTSQTSLFWTESDFSKENYVDELVKQAEMQSFQKFGSRIKPVIEQEFRQLVLPNIERALEETASQFPDEDLKNLVITEQPGGGRSEKIFNVRNQLTNKDVLKFHVRSDNPPQEGYWFNFHYHTYHDQFQSHHDLGSIYWDKNTPPKWMS